MTNTLCTKTHRRLSSEQLSGLISDIGAQVMVAHSSLLPHALSGGLCNQINALVGYSMLAQRDKLALILPNLSSHVQGGVGVPFSDLFDAERFAASVKPHGLRVLVSPPDDGIAPYRPRQFIGRIEWTKYSRWRRAQKKPPISLDDAVHAGLDLSPRMEARVESVARRLDLGGFIGCLHPRVEEDMQALWRYTGAKCAPPRLAITLRHISHHERLRRVAGLFVAVGTDLGGTGWCNNDACAAAKMERLTLLKPHKEWKGRLITTRRIAPLGERFEEEASHKAPPTAASASTAHANARRANTSSTSSMSYIEASLVDLTLCRRAAWFFVGWSSSSFSLTLARYRRLDRGDGWYSSCHEGLTWRNDSGFYPDLCNATACGR